MTPTAIAQQGERAMDSKAIRPFEVNIPESDLSDLRARIIAARLPDKETVPDLSQGVPLATIQKLANCVPRRHPIDAGVRLLGETGFGGLWSGAHRAARALPGTF